MARLSALMPDLLDATVTVPDHVVFRRLATEVVVLNLETGKYHGLNLTAGRMLEVLQERRAVRAAAEELAKEFDQPFERVASDLSGLCGDLAERRLIVVDDHGSA